MASFHHSSLSLSSLFTSNNPTPLNHFIFPSLCSPDPNAQPSKSSSESPPPPLDPIKLVFDRAKAYKKSLHQISPFTSEGNASDKDNTLGLPAPVYQTKLSADISIEKEKKPHDIKELDCVVSDTTLGIVCVEPLFSGTTKRQPISCFAELHPFPRF